jgi:GAF domain-containing protein
VVSLVLPGQTAEAQERLYAVFDLTPDFRWFSLPLVSEERVFGLLWLWGCNLEESDLPAASIFASQVAHALEKARLYTQTQQLAITDELTGSIPPQPVQLGHGRRACSLRSPR